MENEEVVVETQNNEAEGGELENNFVKVSKEEYDKLNQTLGSLKRELKDLKKPKETEETAKTNQPDNVLFERVEKMALRQAGITHQEDIDLMRSLAKKWNVDIEEVVVDEDALAKLERQRTNRSNIEATSGVKGSSGTSSAKNTVEYWKAKGVPPTATDIPDNKLRRKINVELFKANKTGGIKFYNE